MQILQQSGSVDDMRCSLRHYKTETPRDIFLFLQFLSRSFTYEIRHQKRQTVLKMIQSKINQLNKIKLEDL